MAFPSNSELVGVAWLKSVAGIDSGQVATTLPSDAASWAELGFVQATIVGGSPARDTPLRGPVFQVDSWANNPASSKAPWGKAASLAELVVRGTYGDIARRVLTLPGQFATASVRSVHLLTEPRRVENDNASYARYTMDLQVWWVQNGE